jgi:hypothetical protein
LLGSTPDEPKLKTISKESRAFKSSRVSVNTGIKAEAAPIVKVGLSLGILCGQPLVQLTTNRRDNSRITEGIQNPISEGLRWKACWQMEEPMSAKRRLPNS